MSAAEIDHRPDTEAALALAEAWTDGTDEPARVEERLGVEERLARIEAALGTQADAIAHLGSDHGLMADAIDRIESYVRQAVEAIESATQALPAMLGGGGGLGGMLGGLFGGGRREPEPEPEPEPAWSDAWGDHDDDGGR